MTMIKLKPKKPSMTEFSRRYANDPEECRNFFLHCKFPEGFRCDKCDCKHSYVIECEYSLRCHRYGHQHYLFIGTIFQDNRLELYKHLFEMFLFFTSNKGISIVEMRSHLNVNYKTALLLCRKCRVLMAESNADKILDSVL